MGVIFFHGDLLLCMWYICAYDIWVCNIIAELYLYVWFKYYGLRVLLHLYVDRVHLGLWVYVQCTNMASFSIILTQTWGFIVDIPLSLAIVHAVSFNNNNNNNNNTTHCPSLLEPTRLGTRRSRESCVHAGDVHLHSLRVQHPLLLQGNPPRGPPEVLQGRAAEGKWYTSSSSRESDMAGNYGGNTRGVGLGKGFGVG